MRKSSLERVLQRGGGRRGGRLGASAPNGGERGDGQEGDGSETTMGDLEHGERRIGAWTRRPEGAVSGRRELQRESCLNPPH